MNAVLDGKRPEHPKLPGGRTMSDVMWFLLSLCWTHEPSERPTAEHVARTMGRLTLLLSGNSSAYGRYRPARAELRDKMENALAHWDSTWSIVDDEHVAFENSPTLRSLHSVVEVFTRNFSFEILHADEISLWFGQLKAEDYNPEEITPDSLLAVIALLPSIQSVAPEWRNWIRHSSPKWADRLWSMVLGSAKEGYVNVSCNFHYVVA